MSQQLLQAGLFKKDVHYSQELETAIIGQCVFEKDAFSRTFGIITEDHFYFSSNRECYAAMRWMYDNNLPIDARTVCDTLVRKRGFDNFYGYSVGTYLFTCINHVTSSVHLEYYCHCIYEMWIEREILRLTYSGPGEGNSRQKIMELQNKLTLLSAGKGEEEWMDMSGLILELFKHREKVQTQGPGILTGLKSLDQTNGGFMPGDMIVIGARPSVGKSALLGLLAMNMARNGKRAGIISLEMSNAKIAGRLASLDTGVDFAVLYRGLEMDERQQQQLYYQLANQTAQLPIYVSDKTHVSMPEIKAKSQRLMHKHGCDIIFIDYLQLVDSTTGNKNSNRENEVRQMSRGCKIMAKDLDIPVVVLAQLNREVTNRKGEDRYPKLSDLRESGAIEQDADVVMFLHRDWMAGFEVNEDGSSTEREADLIVRKWRDGEPNLRIPLDFDPPKMKFSERRQFGNYTPTRTSNNNYYEKDDDQPF
jgi:replicative DNA helicase